MEIVWAVVSFFVGVLICSFGFIQMLIILRFSLPTTITFSKFFSFRSKSIYAKQIGTLIIWTIIVSAVIACYILFAEQTSIITFFIGFGIVFLIGIGQTGKTRNNMQDYMKTYQQYFKQEDLDVIMPMLFREEIK